MGGVGGFMTKYVLSIDPGLSTGAALISYEEDKAPELVEGWQFGAGVVGLISWLREHYYPSWYDMEWGEAYPATFNLSENRFRLGLLLEDDVEEGYNGETEECEETILRPKEVTVVCEKFNARATSGFSYTTASLEALRCEGALIALGLMPDYAPDEKRWRSPALQYLVGGKDLRDKKKRQHAFLKGSGFYRTGSMLGSKDADDFRSATSHGLNYLAREVGHKPTWDLIRNWEA